MSDWPTEAGVTALGSDREAALELGRKLVDLDVATSVVVHVAQEGQDRHFVSALRAGGREEALAHVLLGCELADGQPVVVAFTRQQAAERALRVVPHPLVELHRERRVLVAPVPVELLVAQVGAPPHTEHQAETGR